MDKTIIKKLHVIEKENNIRILFACESGSRSWGYSSQNSDYDIRLLYTHPMEWYLSIENQKDVMEWSVNQLDITGWDLKKALQLCLKSNPSLYEWLFSGVVYLEEASTVQTLRELVNTYYTLSTLFYHYFKMSKRNYLHFQQTNHKSIKSRLSILRPLLTCLFLMEKQQLPPVSIHSLVKETDPDINEIILSLIHKKKNSDHNLDESMDQKLTNFINQSFVQLEKYKPLSKQKKASFQAELDFLFLRTLKNEKEARSFINRNNDYNRLD
ncbi:nucleotidyltransferase domain-containing protein [Metabacillus arenae]|uniref:Nucleotidyltransferase domain-containing protein n=1 Tax=Metabacillus arenae TaxID=2771434 RepID=A0A926NKV2_9BACI|nr:nucleotidyltransferase domain-containing protein [Metabacillus arenae]MBD1382468.1 nucleotidyltransferase domain-containing protein [Metabacillus arenae]